MNFESTRISIILFTPVSYSWPITCWSPFSQMSNSAVSRFYAEMFNQISESAEWIPFKPLMNPIFTKLSNTQWNLLEMSCTDLYPYTDKNSMNSTVPLFTTPINLRYWKKAHTRYNIMWGNLKVLMQFCDCYICSLRCILCTVCM
jgi:hypothetical protein